MTLTYYRDGEECIWSEHLGQTGDDCYCKHLCDSEEDLLDELWMVHLISEDVSDLALEAYLEGDSDD
jgi:hypothetical protein